MKSINSRLEQVMEYYELNSNRLSEILGYKSPEKIYRLFRSKKNKPSVDIIQDISNKFDNVNINWLLTGNGNMLIIGKKTAQTPPSTRQKTPVLNPKKHIPPSPQADFGQKYGHSLAGIAENTPENSHKPDVQVCALCQEKDRIIASKIETIDTLKNQLRDKTTIIQDKLQQIATLKHENARLSNNEPKANRSAS